MSENSMIPDGLLGKEISPDQLQLRGLAIAARWQEQTLTRLCNEGTAGLALHTALVAVDAGLFQRLAELSGEAAAVLVELRSVEAAGTPRWSSFIQAVTSRKEALEKLAHILAEIGIPGTVELAGLAGFAEAVTRLQSIRLETASIADQLSLCFPLPDPLAIRSAVDFASAVHSAVPLAAPALLQDGWTTAIKAIRDSAADVVAHLEGIQRALSRLKSLGLNGFARAAEAETLSGLRDTASSMLEARDDLPSYLRYASARLRCAHDPLAAIVLTAFETSGTSSEHLPEALDWLLAWAIVRKCSEANRTVFTRSGTELSALRSTFAQADRQRLEIDARKVAAAALQRRVPHGVNSGSRKEWTEGALLQNELGKQRRHIPVRDLLARASNAIMALTPCLMMSPLTVAQYLQPERISFDLIVMDEASQVKPEDAVGALLRGQQVVIVGDPKQLPPTNFFDRALDDPDIDGDEEAESQVISADDRVSAESVLDLGMRAFQPVRRLRWHYRSQHESLIAFSNNQFYDRALVVFPAREGASETLGIELVQVNGQWRDRVNEREAKGIAQAVAMFTRQHPDLSCGIVAMNQPQREFIQAEIDRLTAGDADYVAYREHWEKRLEPPFVKNLENVQGDERDVVFVSLGWGRTPEGALHQRFFPVNRRADGHRRLNVLFTRAKRKIVLFSSIQPEEIVLNAEKTAPGVRVLRDYLLYARDGLIEHGDDEEGEAESPFEASVAHALRALGFEVAQQVGVAGYRVDIAVRHPDLRSRFVIGIECDGASYHSAKSARDRDRLRQEALERLGWRLTRIWSTDWFADPSGQTERLAKEIEAAIRAEPRSTSGKKRLVEGIDDWDFAVGSPEHNEAPDRLKHAHGEEAEQPNGNAQRVGHAPAALLDGQVGKDADLASALRRFRDDIIMHAFPGSEPNRCILRETMIAEIVASNLDLVEDFHSKIPQWLRAGTDGRQMRYLSEICEIVAEHAACSQ